MFEGFYFNALTRITGNQVLKNPNIPNTTLGIFETETKCSIPVN